MNDDETRIETAIAAYVKPVRRRRVTPAPSVLRTLRGSAWPGAALHVTEADLVQTHIQTKRNALGGQPTGAALHLCSGGVR